MYKIISILVAIVVSFFAGVGYSTFNESSDDNVNPSAPAPETVLADCPPPSQPEVQPYQSIASASEQEAGSETPSDEEKSASLDSPLPDKEISNMADLKKYLSQATVDEFNSGLLIDFVDGSSEAFEYVANLYSSAEDEDKKSFLAEIISDTSRPEKVNFASDLINSTDVDKRRYAYAWLSDGSSNKPGITNALVEASYFEENPEALSELISAISEANMRDNSEDMQVTVQRLNELAFHEDEYVSSQAISTVSSLTQDSTTLNMLMNHLNGSSEELKIAALNGLYYFESPDQELMNTVRQLARDPSSSEEIQSIAEDLVSTINEQRDSDDIGSNN